MAIDLLLKSTARCRLLAVVCCTSRSLVVAQTTHSSASSVARYNSGSSRTLALLHHHPVLVSSDTSAAAAAAAASLMQRRSFGNWKPNESVYTLDLNKKVARELLDEQRYPVGTFASSDFSRAKDVLDSFKKIRATDAGSIDLALAVIERVADELVANRDKRTVKYLCDPNYFKPILTLWKKATRQNAKVMSAMDLVEKVQKISRRLPEFSLNLVTFSIILDVAVKRAEPEQAPVVAEELLEFIRREAKQRPELKPSVSVLNQVLQAWARSGLQEAFDRANTHLQGMRSVQLAPDTFSYSNVLRCIGACNPIDINKVERVLQTMEDEGLKLDRANLEEVICCYSKVGNTEKAEEYFDQLLRYHEYGSVRHREAVAASVQLILHAHGLEIDHKNVQRKQKGMQGAEDLFKRVRDATVFDEKALRKVTHTMMDIYVRGNKPDEAENLVEELDAVSCSILIKSHGNRKDAELAVDVLKRWLRESRVDQLDEWPFNELINAWAQSDRADKFDRAVAVLRMMDDNAKCREAVLRPNNVTFACLLKCLSESGLHDAGQRAVNLMDEMERRDVKPTVVTFNTAIQTCLKAFDYERAESLMDRMVESDTRLDLRAYIEILNHWLKIGTVEAAERAEQLLHRMEQLSKSRPSAREVKPTLDCYKIIFKIWQECGDAESSFDSSEQMLNLYDQMMAAEITPDVNAYNVLISHLTLSLDRSVLLKTASMLDDMERLGLKQIYRNHFGPVVKRISRIKDFESAARILIRSAERCAAKRDFRIFLPNQTLIEMVVEGFLKKDQLLEATDLYLKMKSLNVTRQLPIGPESRTHQLLVTAWEQSDHPNSSSTISKLEAIE